VSDAQAPVKSSGFKVLKPLLSFGLIELGYVLDKVRIWSNLVSENWRFLHTVGDESAQAVDAFLAARAWRPRPER